MGLTFSKAKFSTAMYSKQDGSTQANMTGSTETYDHTFSKRLKPFSWGPVPAPELEPFACVLDGGAAAVAATAAVVAEADAEADAFSGIVAIAR